MISSVKVVIKDSSFLLSGMAGTAGLTEGCRWNHAAAGYAGHPEPSPFIPAAMKGEETRGF